MVEAAVELRALVARPASELQAAVYPNRPRPPTSPRPPTRASIISWQFRPPFPKTVPAVRPRLPGSQELLPQQLPLSRWCLQPSPLRRLYPPLQHESLPAHRPAAVHQQHYRGWLPPPRPHRPWQPARPQSATVPSATSPQSATLPSLPYQHR